MAEVDNIPIDSLNRRSDSKERPADGDDPESSPPPPPPPSRRRDREHRDDRDLDLPPRRPDYQDRNRSSPPPPVRERERGDYKRRNSISPPPYRDRRHSPPQFKRSRREDGGYDRRGSPRGGFGHGDRRLGYDYAGGYEREMGARPGFGDERPHGRFGGRAGGYQGGPDWDAGRGAGSYDASNTGSVQREGMMSYKQFIQELEDDILPSEAEHRYQEYKSEYISTQKRAYFSAHKDEEWFKDKYHPTNLVTAIERRNELARKTAKEFMLDLQSGSIDLGPGISASTVSKSGQASNPNSDDDVDAGGKRRRHGRGPAKDLDLLSTAPKVHPVSSDPRRIQLDIEQAQALARKLDLEKGISGNILCGSDNEKMNREKSSSSGPLIIIHGLTSVKGLEGVELLDTLITYLWRIHGLDYYGMVETSEPKGLRHVRGDGKSSNATGDGTDWTKKLDSRWQTRLSGQDPLELRTAKEKIDATAVEALDPYVRKIRDEKYGWKYGCGAKGCTKLFHATEFVYKHLKLKHPELTMEVTAKVREELYFQNYMDDADAPGGTPMMQQPVLKDRLQRRRFGLDSRLKDDRGNRRANGNNDAPEDEGMFDAFGGQGMHVAAPFSSDIPPPVLMPVPGAGPLGPFVPAPPEVAMQMFREQGGPSPFEGGGRNGPHISGPAPILLSPGFRQDPRRLRSYQDLDAPEDEVTVIDYRSL